MTIMLSRCTSVAAALRRGVTDEQAQQLGLPGHNLQPGFTLSFGRAGGSLINLRSDGAVLMKRVAFVFSSARMVLRRVGKGWMRCWRPQR
jgi:hypothetical protein